MYEIYIANHALALCTAQELKVGSGNRFSRVVRDARLGVLRSVVEQMEVSEIEGDVAIEGDVEAMYRILVSLCELERAAGGIVVNKQDEILLIRRRGFWDLPKGKFEEGETPEECAVREVHEETGLQTMEVVRPMAPPTQPWTLHIYTDGNRHILKQTQWFEMRTAERDVKAQAEEDIKEVIWVPRDRLGSYRPNMYRSLWGLVDVFLSP